MTMERLWAEILLLARGIAARIDNAGLDRSANDGSIIQRKATTAH